MYLKAIRFEYKHNNNSLVKNPYGNRGEALSESYYNSIQSELERLNTLVLHMSKFLKCNFKLELKVFPNGQFDFENLNIHITRSFTIRDSRGIYKPLSEMLSTSLECILPFSEYMYDVHLYSTSYQLSHCDIYLSANEEDIDYTINNPFIAPRSLSQWNDAIDEFTQFTKQHYACSVNIPVDEGELFYENGIFILSKREFINAVER